ncbi:MAG: 2-hydroxyacyl-CoA dehydratase family protein, partial [Promethearchaeota archaeon]
LDSCFGTRILLGATWPQLKHIDGTFGYGIRCNWFSKVFEEIGEKSPLIFLEIPNTNGIHAEEMVIESLNQVIAKLEQITGNTITNEKLRKQISLINGIRESYFKILDLASQNKIRLAPLSYANLLSLLHISFTDCLCAPKFLNQTLQQLAKDLRIISKTGGYDTSIMPKLILVNAFGGYEPHLPEFVDNLGGRLFIADWYVFRMLEPIETNGDILKSYARALLKFESVWFDNSALVQRYIEVASRLNIDAILFNNMYGCKSITPSLKLFKEHLQGTDLALVDIGFQNIGDNYEQLKTRIGAVLELIRERKA